MARAITLKIDLGERQTEALRFKDDNPDMVLSDFVKTYPAHFLSDDFGKYKDRRLVELVFDPVVIADKKVQPTASAPTVRRRLDDLRAAEAARTSTVAAQGEKPESHPEKIKDRDAV